MFSHHDNHCNVDDTEETLHRPLLLEEEREESLVTVTNVSRNDTNRNEIIVILQRLLLFSLSSPLSSSSSSKVIEKLKRNFFLIGSLIATIASGIDFYQAVRDGSSVGDDGGGGGTDDDDNHDPLAYWNAYKVLMVMSTLFYLLDSGVHINILWKESRLQNESTQLPRRTVHSDSGNYNNIDQGGQETDALEIDYVDEVEGSMRRSTRDERSMGRWYFASTFGLAALLGLLSSLTVDDTAPWPSYIFGAFSVHLFLVSAIINMCLEWSGYCSSYHRREEDIEFYHHRIISCLGDVFYLMGCVVDVIANFANNPLYQANWLWLSTAGLVSSILWTIDAILYRYAEEDFFNGGG
jgi:hypothetical protein